MRCFHNTFTDIYFHLAAEEYLLKQETDSVFMLWQDTPSVVMGKHQSVQLEVNREWAEEQQIQIARRFSGGGAVYHDLGNVNLTFIETVSRLPDFSLYLHRILDFLKQIGLPAKGDERLGIYLDGLKISGSAQCVHKNRVLYHCTLLYDTNLTALNKVLNPERNIETGVWHHLCMLFRLSVVKSQISVVTYLWKRLIISKRYFSNILVRRDVLILSVRKNWKQSINFGLRNIFAKNGSSVVESG